LIVQHFYPSLRQPHTVLKMKFTSSIIALAVALASSVQAATFAQNTAALTYSSGATVAATGLPISLAITNTAQHSVFGYLKLTGSAAAAYSYGYNFNGTADTANVAVVAANGNVAQYVVSPLYCSLAACNPNVSVTAAYDYVFTSLNVTYGSTSNTVTYVAKAISDANVLLSSSAIGLNVPTADSDSKQPGKLLYFSVPAAASSGLIGNSTNAILTFACTTTVNPFTTMYVVGNGKCPSPTAGDNVARVSFDLSANTTLAGTYNLTNLTTGVYWVYLAPSATVANTLTSSDTIAIAVTPFTNATCVANASGFCSSAATIKSVAGVAFAGVMAAAFMLL